MCDVGRETVVSRIPRPVYRVVPGNEAPFPAIDCRAGLLVGNSAPLMRQRRAIKIKRVQAASRIRRGHRDEYPRSGAGPWRARNIEVGNLDVFLSVLRELPYFVSRGRERFRVSLDRSQFLERLQRTSRRSISPVFLCLESLTPFEIERHVRREKFRAIAVVETVLGGAKSEGLE